MPRVISHSRRPTSQQVTTAPAAPSRAETIQTLRRIYAALRRGQIEDAKQQLTALGQALSLP
ncbi:MAG: hypothetical protein J0L73_26430 [Verrucomicrobia bacterium]|nr:hypothetical protein [Verrucomicrobiota bacterium]